jgi:outer membrane lipoprotein-sorting protein
MKRRCLPLVIGALVAMLCAPSFALTMDEIIEKNVQARGGMEKIKAVKSKRSTGKTLVRDVEFPFTIHQKRPCFFKIETTIQGLTIVQAYDGEIAWQINPTSGGPQKMASEQTTSFRNQADFDGPLLGYKDMGFVAELIGKENIEGSEAYHLKLTVADDSLRIASGNLTTHVYLDAESFLEIKMTIEGNVAGDSFKVDTYLSNHKDVGGLMIPHSIETKIGGRTVSQMIMEKIELNVDIDDSIFRMPGEKHEKEKTEGK